MESNQTWEKAGAIIRFRSREVLSFEKFMPALRLTSVFGYITACTIHA